MLLCDPVILSEWIHWCGRRWCFKPNTSWCSYNWVLLIDHIIMFWWRPYRSDVSRSHVTFVSGFLCVSLCSADMSSWETVRFLIRRSRWCNDMISFFFFSFLTCTHVHGNKTESASPAGGPPELLMPYTRQMNKKKKSLQTSLLIWVSVKLQSHQTEAHKNDTL